MTHCLCADMACALEDPAEFDALTMQVKEFSDWADTELKKLDAL